MYLRYPRGEWRAGAWDDQTIIHNPMAIEIGTVIGKTGTMVEVQLGRKSACTGCKVCILGSDGYMLASAKNSVGASVGDLVRIEYEKPGQVRSGFILYIFPLIAFVPGYLIGASLGSPISPAAEDSLGFFGGILGIASAFFSLYLAQRARNRRKPLFEATSILSSSSGSTPSIE